MVETLDRPALAAPKALQETLAARRDAALAAVKRWAAIDASRFALWTPVFIGAGAAIYFTLRFEPAFIAAPLLLAAALFIALRFPVARNAALAFAFMASGFLLADVRTALVAAPILDHEIGFATVEGRLVSVEDKARQKRFIIDVASIERLDPVNTPDRVRLSWRGKGFDVRPGDVIRIRASLSPPPRSAMPHGYDFARHLYFQRIGAVGFAVSAPEKIAPGGGGPIAHFMAGVEDLRVNLARRIIDKAPGDDGAIVAAVVTGKRGAISENADAAFRDAGIAHLLSISGLHMGLATGAIFFIVRAFLALIEPIAVRFDTKKIAACCALASGLAYLFVSGAGWPAQRAFVMSAIFFTAILFDRRALSLRNVAIAATLILVLAPESVLHPGFQMSFAAVTALIAFYEWASARADPHRSFSSAARLERYVIGIALTDTVSALATAPYSLFHFSRAANFGLAANLISIPLMGFAVMPAAILAIVLMPLDWDGPLWRFSAFGIDIMLMVANWTRNLPGAVTVFPHWPASALVAMTFGGLWLCLMSAPWRLAGLIALPLGVALIIAEPQPQIFLTDQANNVGVVLRDTDGGRRFAVFDRRKGRFDATMWMENAGFDVDDARAAKLADLAPCDRRGCVVEIEERIIAISAERSGLAEDCARAELVIAFYRSPDFMRKNCAALFVDAGDVTRAGAHSFVMSGRNIAIETTRSAHGERPWSAHQYLRINPTSRP